MRLVHTSFTPIRDHQLANGGVPRWNRDFQVAFPEAVHYSWWDFIRETGTPDNDIPEWDRAHVLNAWLRWSGHVTPDDIIVTDGFWGLGLDDMYGRVVSVAHGIWSHLTKDDVDMGMRPEFPAHHAVQVAFRRNLLSHGGRIVAVSDFIAEQMEKQWGFDSVVINNGIDLDAFRPSVRSGRDDRLIVHGVTTANKGFDHIDAVRSAFPNDRVMLLDEAAATLSLPKYQALAQADVVVQPSAYEGNSYFILECLACNVPVIAYNVGLMYHAYRSGARTRVGLIVDRAERKPSRTVDALVELLSVLDDPIRRPSPRKWVSGYTLEAFCAWWRLYLKEEFGYDTAQGR